MLATLHCLCVGFQVVRCGFSGGIVNGQYGILCIYLLFIFMSCSVYIRGCVNANECSHGYINFN